MCINCYPEHVRLAVYEAGKAAGLRCESPEPLPRGAVLRADFERGVLDGLDLAAKSSKKPRRKVS